MRIRWIWVPEGERPKIPTLGNHTKRYVFGFVNPIEGRINYHIGEKITGEEFEISLKKLLSYYKKERIILIIDNARWHKTIKSIEGFLGG